MTSIAIDPTNTYLYVGDAGNNLIFQYQIDAATGALTALTTNASVSAYVRPDLLSVVNNPTTGAAMVYASATNSARVAGFTITAGTGDLVISKPPVTTVSTTGTTSAAAFGH